MRRVSLCVALVFLFSVSHSLAQTASVTGTLIDAATLAPLGGDAFLVRVFTSDGTESGFASPDSAGHYLIEFLAPGTYFVKVSLAPGYVTELHHDIACIAADCPVTAGTPVALGSGATATIDFALTKEGVFAGTVRRASDGSGIAGLNVMVFNGSTSFVKAVATGADGTYVAGGLPTGTYFARTASTGPVEFLTELYNNARCPSLPAFDCRIASGTPIAVTAGATTPGIDFSLDQGATISGTVVADGTQTPLGNVPIAVFSGQVQVAAATTSAGGAYAVLGLPPGAYRVRTAFVEGTYVNEWHDGLCYGCPGTPSVVVVGQSTSVGGIDFSLAEGGGISGQIVCPANLWTLPPAIHVFTNTGVLVRSITRYPYPSVPVACTTEYQVRGLPAGQYFLLARDPLFVPSPFQYFMPSGGILIDKLYGDIPCITADCDVRRGAPVSVTAGQVTAGVNFTMAQGTSSYGYTLPPQLQLFDSRGVELVGVVRHDPFPFGNPSVIQSAVGLPPGIYYARLGGRLHGGMECVDCSPTAGTPIVIHPGDVAFSLDFGPAAAGVRVSGTVTGQPGNVQLSTVTVELYSDAGMLVGNASTDFLGNYSISGVPTGSYFLRTRNDRGYVDEIYPDLVCAACDVRTGTPVAVGSDDRTGLDFSLAVGGVISGSTTDTTGVSVGNVPVSLFTPGGTLVGGTLANTVGQYRVTLPSGSYRARAEASDSHGAETFSEQRCTSGECDVTAGTPIVVTDGTITSNINFTLASCSAMTLSPPSLASGVVGRSYRQVFSTSGGVGPYAYHVTEGLLPVGTALAASSGVLEGTPTYSGRHSFTVGAIDASGCATARAYTLDVQACAFTLSPSSATVPAAGGTVTITIGDACGPQTVTGGATFVHEQSNTAGQVVLLVDAHIQPAPRTADLTIGRRVFTVLQAGTGSQPPFGALDVPLDGTQASGSIAVGGWALDDLEVRRVQLFRDPVGGEPAVQIFLGTAVFVPGARPDVQRAYPTYPHSDRAGWGFLILTNMLPNQGNGAFRIYAYAEDAEGARTLLGARTIVAINAGATLPFGAIDTPAQGETVAGSAYLNWGWALTPQPKIIPFDGSTIQVLVDGVPMGNPTYNLFRSDVSGLFPGLANSGGPVGYRVLDTTGFAEGLHTIAWIVSDDQGAATGIGSRYFSVANSADAQPMSQRAAMTAAIPDPAARVRPASPASTIATGPGLDSLRHAAGLAEIQVSEAAVLVQEEGGARRLPARQDGSHAVTLAGLERLTLTLGGDDARCPGVWAGYLIDRATLRDLPVGAAIDPTGTFYWQPGPGFLGTFELLFVRTACDGSKERLPVTVTIGTK